MDQGRFDRDNAPLLVGACAMSVIVVVRVMMTGKHVGEFMGIPPSGKDIRVPVCDWTRVRNGKAVEHWGVSDTSALMA